MHDAIFLKGAFENSFKENAFAALRPHLFRFEATILATQAIFVSLKYALHLIDMKYAGQWHNKSAFKFYLELRQCDSSALYVVFFMIIFVSRIAHASFGISGSLYEIL